MEKKNHREYSNQNQKEYRDRLAKVLKQKDESERYNILEKEKTTNKMYIETARDGSLGKEIAFDFIKNEKGKVVTDNIKKFKPSDYKEIADLLIEKGYYRALAKNINNFEGLDHKSIVKKAIETNRVNDLFDYSNFKIKGLDKEIADLLIKKGEIRTLAKNIESFVQLDKNIAKALIKIYEEGIIIYNLKIFEGLDKDIFMSIYDWSIKSLGYVIDGLGSFGGLDIEVAKIIIEKGKKIDGLARGLSSFEGLDKDIADLLIEEGYIEDVAKNLNSFEKLGKEIKNLLIEKGYELYVEMYPDKF